MKFIHTADWHAGYKQYGFPEREQDIYRAIDHIVDDAIKADIDVVVIAGDLFDSTKPQGYVVEYIQRAVDKLVNGHGIEVWGIDGNHDTVNNDWLRVCGIKPLSAEPATFEGVAFMGIDATRPAVFNAKIDELIKQGTKIDVLVIHQALGEMADFLAQEITAFELAPKLQQLGVRYVAMGDIHDYKEMVVGGIRFVYPGAIEVKAIDEERDKSYSVVDITKDELHTAFVPIPTRKIVEKNLRTQADLDTLLADLGTGDKQPMAILWYEPDVRDLAKRAEALLQAKGVLYRIVPIATSAIGTVAEQLAKQGVDRKGSLIQLKDAVKVFFDENTDQYQLVFQMLESPDNIADTMKQYLKTKGVV